MLINDNHSFNSDKIKEYLTRTNKNMNIIVKKSVTSTNSLLKEMAIDGAPEGTVLVAEMQTGGRGRLGRTFHSPSDTGLYFSILLRPNIPAAESLSLTTAAAVAVAKSIEAVSEHQADIKWVNDIYINDKKVCGILTEGAINPDTGLLDYAIVGIGINLCPPKGGFPSDIDNIAGSVFSNSDDLSSAKCNILAQTLNHFMSYYSDLDVNTFFAEYKERSFLIGRKIYVIDGKKHVPATALDLTSDCHLIVQYDDGSIRELSSGEVSIKLMN